MGQKQTTEVTRVRPYPDAGISVGLGHTDISISLDHGRLGFAKGAQVLHLVIDILDGEALNLQSHAAHVGGSYFSH